MVTSSFAGFLFAGMGLFVSVSLEISLRIAHIHPDDYDSAEDWEKCFRRQLTYLTLLEYSSYFSLAIATCYNVFLKTPFSKILNFNSMFVLGVTLMISGIVLPFTHHSAAEALRDRRKFKRDDAPSNVEQALTFVNKSFAQYGKQFNAAKIEIKHLLKLTKNDLLGMNIPLGDAISIIDGFRKLKLPDEGDQKQNYEEHEIIGVSF